MINGGERGRDELDQRIITKNEQLHRAGITLLNTSGNNKGLEKEVTKTNNSLRYAMEVHNKSSKLLR